MRCAGSRSRGGGLGEGEPRRPLRGGAPGHHGHGRSRGAGADRQPPALRMDPRPSFEAEARLAELVDADRVVAEDGGTDDNGARLDTAAASD